MEFTGKIIQVLKPVGGTSSKTGKEWKKIQFVVEEENKQFPNKVFFEVFGEDKFKPMPIVVGNMVNVQFDIDASEYKGRWYNKVSAWLVTIANETQPESTKVLPQPPVQPATPVESGLPF